MTDQSVVTDEVEATPLGAAIARLRNFAVVPRADLAAVADTIERELVSVYDEGRTQGHLDAMRAHCRAKTPPGRLLWIMEAMDAAELDPNPYRKDQTDG